MMNTGVVSVICLWSCTSFLHQQAYLQVLIQNHHEEFKELYPDYSITPTMQLYMYDTYAKNNIEVHNESVKASI